MQKHHEGGGNSTTDTVTTTTHTESFGNELHEKGAYCAVVCEKTFLSKSSFSSFLRWAIGGVLIVFVPVAVVYGAFIWHQGTAVTQCQDDTKSNSQQIAEMKVTISTIADMRADVKAIRTSMTMRGR